MANTTAAIKTILAATAPLGLCTQLLLSAAAPVQAQPYVLSLAPALNAAVLKANNAAVLKANSGAILGALGNPGIVQNNAAGIAQDSESAANERIRMAEIAAQREQAQLQAQQSLQQAQAQQTQGWIQLGVGLLGSLLQPRQQAAPAAEAQPDLAQLQQLIQEQQAQIQALQQQQQQAQAQPAQ
jgi:hypothetical protein